MMHRVIGKLRLLGYQGDRLGRRQPAADTFALLASLLAGARTVTRVELAGPSTLHAFEVGRAERGPALVF